MDDEEIRHTGIWPFSLFSPGSGALEPPQSVGQTAKLTAVFDPVALAWKAGPKLMEAGWVGLEIMPRSFLWKIVDAEQAAVGGLAEAWATAHQSAIADLFAERLLAYTVDDVGKAAMEQSIDAYRRGYFLATVRTLMPEVERFGRMVAAPDGTMPTNQKEAIAAIKGYLGSVPVHHFDPIESLGIYSLIEDDLFAACFTAADAAKLGAGPNRHAELHGLATYGNLRGATKMLCVGDFLLHSVTAAQASAPRATG